ncbi:hypothetical protein AAC387_Pa01g1845 [Persea americana]
MALFISTNGMNSIPNPNPEYKTGMPEPRNRGSSPTASSSRTNSFGTSSAYILAASASENHPDISAPRYASLCSANERFFPLPISREF